jgi:hypothetical protein
MSVIRVEKTKDYTIMSNYHLKEPSMSLKAKGLLSLILSLPDNWNYSISGLVNICKENETSIKNTLDELKQFGYLEITKIYPNESKSGRIEYVYTIYERPKQEGKKQDLENLPLENLGLENQDLENQGQLNTNNKLLNNKILNNKELNNIYKEQKQKFGEYKRILLTEGEYNKLIKEYGKEFIDYQIMRLDEYVESNNNKNKYKNFNLVLRKAIREKWFEKKLENNYVNKNYFKELLEEYENDEKRNTYDAEFIENSIS